MEYDEFDEENDEVEGYCRCEICEFMREKGRTMNREKRRWVFREMERELKKCYLFHIGVSVVEMKEGMEEFKMKSDT